MVEEMSIKRTKEAVEEDVQRLRDWLDKQPHLPQDVEHSLLLAFVCGTKTLESAKRKLDNYYSNRNRMVKLYDEVARDVNAQFREKSRALNHFFLTNTTPEGHIVYFVSFNDCFSKVFDHPHEATRMLMMLELRMKQWSDTSEFGGYFVFDCDGVPASAITMVNSSIVAAILGSFQDGYPMKLHGCFCINASSTIEFIVNNLVKPVLKAKLYNRTKVFKEGASNLKEYLPLEMLPSDYGGNDKSSAELNDYWLDQLEENREWFLKSTRQSSDEKKRPPDSQNTYGIDGTFRKLAVD
ncbi:unnamed protein product [Nezara viridula]|uniref:CRAL-TRIO domain-containing protein n=1 Tax=Nezara viridula TaxID=85310 RepID=A0A9P0MP41_NEZVI|nr:unnamed protein product [Nezara viridula]